MRVLTTDAEIEKLKAAGARITSALKEKEAQEAANVAGRRAINELEARINSNVAALELRSDADLDSVSTLLGRVGVLQRFVSLASDRHRDVIHELEAALRAAVYPIQQVSCERSVPEGMIFRAGWTSQLDFLPQADTANRIRLLSELSKQVLRDIDTLLSQRVPSLLSASERRDQVLRDINNNSFLRRLTMEEVVSGTAAE